MTVRAFFVVPVLVALFMIAAPPIRKPVAIAGRTYIVKNGQEFTVKLSYKSGYEWDLYDYDEKVVKLVGEPDKVADKEVKNKMWMVFKLKALKVGDSNILFHYKKPGERAAGKVTFTIKSRD